MNTALSRQELVQKYDDVSSFSEGLARVVKDGKEFHIRPDGQPAYQEKYDYVSDFSEGLARVVKDGKYFHIRPDGQPAYKDE